MLRLKIGLVSYPALRVSGSVNTYEKGSGIHGPISNKLSELCVSLSHEEISNFVRDPVDTGFAEGVSLLFSPPCKRVFISQYFPTFLVIITRD